MKNWVWFEAVAIRKIIFSQMWIEVIHFQEKPPTFYWYYCAVFFQIVLVFFSTLLLCFPFNLPSSLLADSANVRSSIGIHQHLLLEYEEGIPNLYDFYLHSISYQQVMKVLSSVQCLFQSCLLSLELFYFVQDSWRWIGNFWVPLTCLRFSLFPSSRTLSGLYVALSVSS